MAAARQKEIKLSRTVVATKTLTVGRLKFWVDEAMRTVNKLQSQQFNTRLRNPALAFVGQSWGRSPKTSRPLLSCRLENAHRGPG